MKKTLMTLTAVAVVGLSSTLLTAPAHAETVDQLETKQQEIQQKRQEVKANLTDAEGQIADILIDLEKLNEEIEKVKNALKENQKQLDETEEGIAEKEQEVAELEEEIAALEEAIEARYEILKERAVSYQKSGGDISYMEVIFGSKSFGDFIGRVNAVNKITESDATLMKKQEEDKQAVEEKQNAVLDKLDEMNEMKIELEGIVALIEDQKAENEAKEAQLKTKRDDLVALKDELQIEDSNLVALENEVRENIRIANQPAPVAVEANTTSGESGGELTTLSSQASNNSSQNINNSSNEKSSKKSVSEAPASRPAASGDISVAINAGFAHLGTPYVWGGKTPSGFDCSGFVSWAFAQAGISIPSSTSALATTGTKVSSSNMQPGDIVFFDTYKKDGHVGIYLGGGKFIGSQSTPGLSVADMTQGYWKDTFKGHVRSVK